MKGDNASIALWNITANRFLHLRDDIWNVRIGFANASIENNTFSVMGSGSFYGSLNATSINASNISAARFTGKVDCGMIDGGSDSHYCADATGAGAGGAPTDIRYYIPENDSRLPNAIASNQIQHIDEPFRNNTDYLVFGRRQLNTTSKDSPYLNLGMMDVYNFRSEAVVGSDAGFFYSQSPSTILQYFNVTKVKYFMVYMRLNQNITTIQSRSMERVAVGMFSTTRNNNLTNIDNGFFFNYSSDHMGELTGGNQTTWWANSCNASICTRTNITDYAKTGIERRNVDANWTKFEIIQDCTGSDVTFKMNGMNVTHIKSHDNMSIGFNGSKIGVWVESINATSNNVAIAKMVMDYCLPPI